METNELELNRWAHELLGNCWHINSTVNGGCKDCPDCSQMIIESPEHYRPAYTESLDLAAKVEAKAIELVGEEVYIEHALSLMGDEFLSIRYPEDGTIELSYERLAALRTASALTRVQAAKRAVEGIK